ncbi:MULTISPECIES: hypothetical protein [Pasteurellaceae]|nr:MULTISPECIES: hypothetical protein [Pasteurellaceae]MCU9999591.1 hypothetical protein [[Pasteurella] aerogenes]QXG52620.1 hypothetical protein KSF84_11420 [Pasteurella multocida]UQZ26744.1 hypothetical protein M6G44_10920 [Actinobacillus pleuropneumoniae]HDX1015794.1 hypothetical protein [Pasteurella multocida]HDX1016070.1 hypothetical protein [Pasteurella multocida]
MATLMEKDSLINGISQTLGFPRDLVWGLAGFARLSPCRAAGGGGV